jgi:DNA helicase-2/ATP-dependent DNA helicase PcrA
MTRAMEQLHMTCVRSRQVFGQRRIAEPSRFLTEVPRSALAITGEPERDAVPAMRMGTPWRTRAASPYRETIREELPPDTGEVNELRPGVRVRHPLFGVGTVLRSEGSGAELKVTVSFAAVGAKKLVARYAGLEPL